VVGGRVGRDVRAQVWSLGVHGEVGRDLVARIDDLTVGPGAAVAGDILYKASDRVDLAEGAAGGQVSERRVLAPVWAKALTRAFAWLSLLGFILGSFVVFWLFRSTAERSVWVVSRSPWRAGLVGLGVVGVPPLLTLPLAVSLVGLPVAVLLLVAWLGLLALGPAPAVAWAGRRILGALRRCSGVAGGDVAVRPGGGARVRRSPRGRYRVVRHRRLGGAAAGRWFMATPAPGVSGYVTPRRDGPSLRRCCVVGCR
jgi:hypothetical protein